MTDPNFVFATSNNTLVKYVDVDTYIPVNVSGGWYVQNTVPTTATNGDRWLNTVNGVVYTYTDDGDNLSWVEYGTRSYTSPIVGLLDGGQPDSNYSGITSIDAGVIA